MTARAPRIIVTGGNRGIGLEVCRQLAAQGADVLLTARDAKKGQAAADSLGVAFSQLDVSDRDSIDAFAKKMHAAGAPLHALVNNAATIDGAGYGHTLLTAETDAIETMLRINTLGPLYLTRALYTLMPPDANVVNVSSGAGVFCSDFDRQSGWYGTTKTFLNAITCRLALHLSDKNIKVNAVCPGWVQTDMGGPNAERPVQKGAETIVWLATNQSNQTGKFYRDKKIVNW